ncbi:hypothetical protein ACFRCI_50095, partial [Streptomyces sp. NPDC056638]|uniref:hypothetical protein n=1 Tax=Streptomyces sp. NPDC056638 TaxID=3345887 RepID=UPI0036BD823A
MTKRLDNITMEAQRPAPCGRSRDEPVEIRAIVWRLMICGFLSVVVRHRDVSEVFSVTATFNSLARRHVRLYSREDPGAAKGQ